MRMGLDWIAYVNRYCYEFMMIFMPSMMPEKHFVNVLGRFVRIELGTINFKMEIILVKSHLKTIYERLRAGVENCL